MNDAIIQHNGGTTLTGSAVHIYRAATVRSGLKMYAATGMLLTRGATPKTLMTIASEITGRKFKARDYAGAQAALDQWITEAKCKVAHIDERA